MLTSRDLNGPEDVVGSDGHVLAVQEGVPAGIQRVADDQCAGFFGIRGHFDFVRGDFVVVYGDFRASVECK